MAEYKQSLTFLSYSREDSKFALKLAKDLRTQQVNIWVDQLDIAAGMRWDQSVEKALEDSECFMIVLSPDAVGSYNVMDELAFALEERKKVIPILYRSCKIPFRLRRIQRIDFTGDYNTSLGRLLDNLELGGQAAAFRDPKARQ